MSALKKILITKHEFETPTEDTKLARDDLDTTLY